MHLLVDADSLCYAAGFVANEPDQEKLACWQLDKMVETILKDTLCESYQLYISGSNNFRYSIYPEYKATRLESSRPIHLVALREHLVTNWGATVSDGNEADDQVGISQWAANASGAGDTCISHIDKDIDMIPGRHYNPRKNGFYDVSDQGAINHFYWQLIMGDRVDNIPGYDGKMRQKVPKFLEPKIEELYFTPNAEGMLKLVGEMWGAWDSQGKNVNPERLAATNQAAHCLWIQRVENDDWRQWLNVSTMEAFGLPVDSILSLPPHFEVQANDGPQSSPF